MTISIYATPRTLTRGVRRAPSGLRGRLFAAFVFTRGRRLLALRSLIAPEMDPRPATSDYVDRILAPARERGFPDWYLARILSFRT